MAGKKDPRKQYLGKLVRAMGKRFEDRLARSFEYYQHTGMALVEKTPEPMRILRRLDNGKFIACFEKKAQPDYKGTIKGGRTVVFEAKFTSSDKIEEIIANGNYLVWADTGERVIFYECDPEKNTECNKCMCFFMRIGSSTPCAPSHQSLGLLVIPSGRKKPMSYCVLSKDRAREPAGMSFSATSSPSRGRLSARRRSRGLHSWVMPYCLLPAVPWRRPTPGGGGAHQPWPLWPRPFRIRHRYTRLRIG